jgi:O-antigen/teichoic acid export membrane protein
MSSEDTHQDVPVAAEAVQEDVLRSPEAGPLVIRGGAIRGFGYAVGVLLAAVASVFLLRYLGVVEFGRYVTVLSLIAIVSGVTDAGLTAVGARDLALRPPGVSRQRLLANLLGLRIVLTPLGVLGAVLFALIAGYDRTLVLGTLLAGIGLVLINLQATTMLPLSVELQIGRLTAVEVLRQAAAVVTIGILVAAGASLLPFFAAQIVVGVVVLLVTPWLVGRASVVPPAFERAEWRTLVREALPMAAALIMNVIYFRLLIILMSLLATAAATGLFATSFRIFEILFGIPVLVLSVALPVLATSRAERERIRYQLQRMTEIAAVAAAYFMLAVLILAEPLIRLLAGPEYEDAVPVLRIQSIALIAVFLGQVWQLGLIAIRRQSALAVANGVALLLVLGLGISVIPSFEETGAAVVAVLGETVLAAMLLASLARADRTLVPTFGFAIKVAVAAVLAILVLALPFPSLIEFAVATAVYAVVIWATGVLPSEVLDAFVRRRAALDR